MKVLIADNDNAVADVVELIFTQNGHHSVIKAHNTEDARDAAKENPDIKLVLLDMDCLAGGSITGVLRTLCPDCKIILYSGGLVGDEDPKEYDVDAVLSKKHQLSDLLEVVMNLCLVGDQ